MGNALIRTLKKGGLSMFRNKRVESSDTELNVLLTFLQQKYASQLAEIERHFPIKWYIESNCYRIWAPSTTLAFTHLGDQQLSICFLLHNIKKEIHTKHNITDKTLLKHVTECFVEFLFLHELKHMYQFCEGLTLKDYKKKGSYKSNPFEVQANQFALETIKDEDPFRYNLLHFLIDDGKINHTNEQEWQLNLLKREKKFDPIVSNQTF